MSDGSQVPHRAAPARGPEVTSTVYLVAGPDLPERLAAEPNPESWLRQQWPRFSTNPRDAMARAWPRQVVYEFKLRLELSGVVELRTRGL